MKIKCILIIIVFISIKINAQTIEFKDKNLKIALLELGYDSNKNNEIEIREIETVTELKVSEKGIKKLEDLKYFKNLKTFSATTNEIESLDVFFDNKVIEEIYVGENQFGKKLTIKNIPNLKILYVFRSGIEAIEFIGTDNIRELGLQGNLFEDADFKSLTKLESLNLSINRNLKTINVEYNISLIQLYLNSTNITKLDIRNNQSIKTLYIDQKVELIKTKSQKKLKAFPLVKGDAK